jgi:hypothetical protein
MTTCGQNLRGDAGICADNVGATSDTNFGGTMYDHHIRAMADQLVKAGLITEEQSIEAQKALQKEWDDKIAIVWSREDILTHAKDSEIILDDEAAGEILDSLLDNHDCVYGITWDTIYSYVSEDRYAEESKVRMTPFEELPTIINDITTSGAQKMLKARMKEGK